MDTLKISEIFYSAQGEGRFIGVPSVFLRTFGCNFKCAGFGLPAGQKTTEPDDIGREVHLYKTFMDLPLAKTGCDSYASWHPAFKHLSPSYTVEETINALLSLTPNHRWIQDNGNDVHLVITGGEPLLGWQQLYPELLANNRMSDLRNLTFETNGSQELYPEVWEYLQQDFTNHGRHRDRLTFSVSPKLPGSGEKWDNAIRPDIIKSFDDIGMTYLKFVISTEQDLEDVDRAVFKYREAGFTGPVYLMPVGGVADVYNLNTQDVANMAMRRGYRYSPRLQVDLWRNAWGT